MTLEHGQPLCYNQTTVEILDDNDNREPSNFVSTTYNWNDEIDDWREDCQTKFERVELTCYEAGGRPMPSDGKLMAMIYQMMAFLIIKL